tara:strand:+ start:40396 stop:43005 length:2610 start_codon:yes stop_codon:yes gene_type:complete
LIPGSDTAKQDLSLVIVSTIALMLFFWFYADFHPFSSADNSYAIESVENNSIQWLQRNGYEIQDQPYTKFDVSSTLLDTLQNSRSFNEFYSNSLHKAMNPVFYWRSDYLINKIEPESSQGSFSTSSVEKITVRLSESGKLIGFYNPAEIIPERYIQPEVLQFGFNVEEIPEFNAESENPEENFRFSFLGNTGQSFNSDQISRGEVQLVNRAVAERMANYYLALSGWPEMHFNMDSIEIISISDINTARITYKSVDSEVWVPVTVVIDLLPGGGLISLTYDYEIASNNGNNIMSIISGMRGFLIAIIFFWIVILLFLRFRLRLVDLKVSILVAVIGGFILPALFISQQLYMRIHSFEDLSLPFFIQILVGAGFMAAISSMGFFAVTAISDSITRQNWPAKLRTIDSIRSGYLINIPLGLSIIRGICWGFILSFAIAVTLTLIPGSYLSIDTVFSADNIYLSFIFSTLGNFIFTFLAAQIIFLILIGKLSSNTKKSWIIISVTAIIYVIADPHFLSIGGWGANITTSMVTGLIIGWVYWKEDFLAAFIGLFVFMGFIGTASGWLMGYSPDSLAFIVFLSIILLGLIYGGTNIVSRRTARDIPQFVPDYIQELASENRIKQELQIARKVQQSFLPLKTPNVPGLDVFAICKPAFETGGDYYDFIELDDKKLAITIGDVSGKGIQAAFYMTFTKGVLYALCNDYTSSVEVMCRTNKMFRKNAAKGTFISLIFGIFDEEKSIFRFSRAGHNPLLYFNKKEKKLHIYQPEGIAIGMADMDQFSSHISEQSVKMEEGDILIFYTDGMVEAVNREHELFGEDRLYALIKKYHDLPSQQMVEKIEEHLAEFVNGTDQYDDMTIIVVKKKVAKLLKLPE